VNPRNLLFSFPKGPAARGASRAFAGPPSLFTVAAVFVFASSGALPACHPVLNGGSRHVDCEDVAVPADMRCIPGGGFTRGSDRASLQEDTRKKVRDEAPVQRLELSTFLMDTTEVTYSAYQACVVAGKCEKAGPNYRGYSNPEQPMLGANWFAARDYCAFRGKRLPTEAEWEKAARGPDGELYPTGNEAVSCKTAIIQEGGEKGCGTGRTWDVRSRPVERYGLYDMGGNSWEWVADWYSPDYAQCGPACRGLDPRGPCAGEDQCPGHKMKIVRGGSWWWDAESSLASNRRPHFPANKPFHHFGFRCAADAVEK
jgi:sulfatase modifying factor 1